MLKIPAKCRRATGGSVYGFTKGGGVGYVMRATVSHSLVPILDMTKQWMDTKLYKRYGLTEGEIVFIESKIRPMEARDGGER